MFSEMVQPAEPLTQENEESAIEEVEKILEETKTGIVLKDILKDDDLDSETEDGEDDEAPVVVEAHDSD